MAFSMDPLTQKSFCFSTGVSGKPKKMDLPIIPRPVPPYLSIQVGEDALFTRYDSIGVADGVGGWAKTDVVGANAALYSLKLMHYVGSYLNYYDDFDLQEEIAYEMPPYSKVQPKDILRNSYELVNKDACLENIVGSTTALIGVLRNDELRIANIGDCGLMLIRGGEAIFRNEEQQHSFNFPFQLGTVSNDSPDDAQSYTLKIQKGDIVVMGTDGLFDNVFDDDIIDIVNSLSKKSSKTDPQIISDALLRKAREVAEGIRYGYSPFQERAIQEGFYYQGGKVDDTTVIVGVVQ